MGIIQRYSSCLNSSNLKSDEHHHAPDTLAAVALGADFGGLLFRVKYANMATAYPLLKQLWTKKVIKKAELRKWPVHISAKKVAKLSLNYWFNNTCPVCSGKGLQTIPFTPVLDENKPCICCHGTGFKPLVCEPNWKDYILDMVEDLNSIERRAASRAMRKLRNSMDF